MAHPHDLDTTREENEGAPGSVARGPRSEGVLTVLRGENPGALYTLDGPESVIGRNPDLAVAIPDDTLSRRHARIQRLGKAFAINDLGSKNGTFVDGKRVQGTMALEDGCQISLGTRTVLHFRLHDAAELEAVRKTQALTVSDPLTGVFNRRHLQERLWSEAAFSRRHKTPLSLILLDIDHFKLINDQHGHPVGDATLCALTKALSVLTRTEDVLARVGGEEFALVARGINRADTLLLAERVRASIATQRVPTDHGDISFTVSIGVAHTETGADMDAQQLYEAADRALYSAKDAGRNSVSIAPSEE